jgi:hypothetical protein
VTERKRSRRGRSTAARRWPQREPALRSQGRTVAALLDDRDPPSPQVALDWIAAELGCVRGGLRRHPAPEGLVGPLDLRTVAAFIESFPPDLMRGLTSPDPGFALPPPGDPVLEPQELVAIWRHLPGVGCAVGLVVDERLPRMIQWFIPRAAGIRAAKAFDALREQRVDEVVAGLRGRAWTVCLRRRCLALTPMPQVSRDEVDLRFEVWTEIDQQIIGRVRHHELLNELGVGYEGSYCLRIPEGSEAIVDVLATDLAAHATVLVLPGLSEESSRWRHLRRAAQRCAPSVILQEQSATRSDGQAPRGSFSMCSATWIGQASTPQ